MIDDALKTEMINQTQAPFVLQILDDFYVSSHESLCKRTQLATGIIHLYQKYSGHFYNHKSRLCRDNTKLFVTEIRQLF